jgi:hypothetical protein
MKINEYTRQLEDLVTEIAKAAEGNKKECFIGGGLAIDLSLGRISRNHHDIDFHPMLKDTPWWIKWFENRGLVVKKIEEGHFPEVYKVFDKNMDVVDLWPLDLKESVLLINKDGKYVDSGRHWGETRIVKYNGVHFRVENPQRVLEQKLRHIKEGQPLREEDKLDFQLLGQKLE